MYITAKEQEARWYGGEEVEEVVRRNEGSQKVVTNNRRRMTKGKLWEKYHEANKLKAWIYTIHLAVASSRYEKELYEYLSTAWGNQGTVWWKAAHLVYIGMVPFSHHQYVGETVKGLEGRTQTHVQETMKGHGHKQSMYTKLKEIGVHHMIWMPLHTFKEPVSKYTRLFHEAQHIWQRNCDLNKLGTRTWRDRSSRHDGELVAPKRNRFQLVKRLVELHRGKALVTQEEERRRKKEGITAEALQDRGRMFSMMARLARRPLHKSERFAELGVIRQLREL